MRPSFLTEKGGMGHLPRGPLYVTGLQAVSCCRTCRTKHKIDHGGICSHNFPRGFCARKPPSYNYSNLFIKENKFNMHTSQPTFQLIL